METTTTFTNTTNAPYIMSNETKLFICIGIGLFTIPIIFCILISILDLAKHYLGVRNFEDGISPGQACVFYDTDKQGFKVLGGGWII